MDKRKDNANHAAAIAAIHHHAKGIFPQAFLQKQKRLAKAKVRSGCSGVKDSERQTQALSTMQELISKLNALESKGFDLQQFNRFMETWVKTKDNY